MPTIARLQASDCDNPELDVYTTTAGALTDVASLEYTISEDVSNPGTPVQVYPPTGRAVVDLALCPTGQKLSTGRYVALWTPPVDELLGTHVLNWFFKLTPTSPEQTFCEDFTVIAEITGSSSTGYCTISQLRDEGVTLAQASDDRLQTLISRASRMIDFYTGRYFEPRSKVIMVDGTGRRGQPLNEPIISISKIRLIADDISASASELDLGDVRIYNRHLSQNLLNPDDRDNPLLEFLEFDERYESFPIAPNLGDLFVPRRWPEGTQNVEITGIFGYTDPDGSPTGRTPELIQYACMKLVIKQLPLLTDSDGLSDTEGWRVTQYKTRDQSITYADPSKLGSRGVGPFTGDPEIDTILAGYMRPPGIAGV